MKIRVFFITLCFSIMLYGCGNALSRQPDIILTPQSEDECLRFQIALDKNTYSLEDDAKITYSLQTNDCGWIFVNKRFFPNNGVAGEINLYFTSSNGKQMMYPIPDGRVQELNEYDFVFLRTNESVSYTQELFTSVVNGCDPGECYIQAVYENNKDVPNRSEVRSESIWKGTLTSNYVKVTVKSH